MIEFAVKLQMGHEYSMVDWLRGFLSNHEVPVLIPLWHVILLVILSRWKPGSWILTNF